MPTVGYWDLALVIVVALMSTLVSYVHAPKWKAFILCFPFPFTIASLALGQSIGVSHAMGLTIMLLYTHCVRWLHVGARLPIVPSIFLSVLGYVLIGGTLAKIMPDSPITFWPIICATLFLAVGLYLRLPHRIEPGHRSPLPVALKFFIVVLIVIGIVAIKNHLRGFMTFCPMVGILAAYEGRKSLWTIGRQIPVVMIAMIPMLATIYLTQQHYGLGIAILCGWAVFPFILFPLTIRMWRKQEKQELGNGVNQAMETEA